jgi:hypothetical protein
MFIILRLRQPVKGCLPGVRAGGREAVLVAARVVAACWMVAMLPPTPVSQSRSAEALSGGDLAYWQPVPVSNLEDLGRLSRRFYRGLPIKIALWR